MSPVQLDVPHERIAEFCRKWNVKELALFGSVLRDDFRPDSDVDVLVTFAEDATWRLWQWDDMVTELRTIFGRSVDLVNKKWLRNPFRRHAILTTKQVLYAA